MKRPILPFAVLVLSALAFAVHADTFTNRTTGETVKGKCVGKTDDFYVVKGDDGRPLKLPRLEWELKFDLPGTPPATPARPGATEKDEAPPAAPASGQKKPEGTGASKPQVMEVEAEGTDADPEKARLAAFSNAIQKAVGVLVDSETLVKNDDLIKEQILTFSRAYVEQFHVLKTWEKDGLHYVSIRARVAKEMLVKKLQDSKIALRELPGELMEKQIRHDVENEQNAAEMLRTALEDFTPTKLLRVEMVGEPEVVERDETHAKVRLKARPVPDLEKWSAFRQGLEPLLQRISTQHATFIAQGRIKGDFGDVRLFDSGAGETFLERFAGGPGERSLIFLLRTVDSTWTRTEWHCFNVPTRAADVLGPLNKREFNVRFAMLAADNIPLAEANHRLGVKWGTAHFPDRYYTWYAIAPLQCNLWHSVSSYYPPNTYEKVVHIELSKLRNVVKCAAYIEEATNR